MQEIRKRKAVDRGRMASEQGAWQGSRMMHFEKLLQAAVAVLEMAYDVGDPEKALM